MSNEKQKLNEMKAEKVAGGAGGDPINLTEHEELCEKFKKDRYYEKYGYKCVECGKYFKNCPFAHEYGDLDKPICRMCFEHFDNGHYGPPITNFW